MGIRTRGCPTHRLLALYYTYPPTTPPRGHQVNQHATDYDSIANHQAFSQSAEYPTTIEGVEFFAGSFPAHHVPLLLFPPGEVFEWSVVSWVTFNVTGVANGNAMVDWQAGIDGFLGNLTGVGGCR